MKNLKIKKIILITIMSILLVSVFINNSVFADTGSVINGFTGTDSEADEGLENITGTFVDVIRVVGSSVAIIILVVCALKYILAAADEKASIKKYATTYVIGAVILFAASNILKIAISTVEKAVK